MLVAKNLFSSFFSQHPEEPTPTTLGNWLEQRGLSVDELLEGTNLRTAAHDLLRSRGVAAPKERQIRDTQSAIYDAIHCGTWRGFVPSTDAPLIAVEDVAALRPDSFSERQAFSQKATRVEALRMKPRAVQALQDYSSGRAGRVMAASFINAAHRGPHDFSHAYGATAWKNFLRGQNYLDQIPAGQFVERIDLELLAEVNRRMHTPDEGIKAEVVRMGAAALRGRVDEPGRLREGRTLSQVFEFSDSELTALEEAGVRFHSTDVLGIGAKHHGFLEYPDPQTVKPKLLELIAKLKQSLAAPDVEPIPAIADFTRRLVSLHPFEDGNGRTARAVMNRLLAEYGLPPAILRNSDLDSSLSPTAWENEVREGMARTLKFIGSAHVHAPDQLLAAEELSPLSPDGPQPGAQLALEELPFQLGKDGFLYDPTGRPSLVLGQTLVPLSQLDHLVLCRRLLSMTREDAAVTLVAITDATRKLAGGAIDPKMITVADDGPARAADAAFKAGSDPRVAKLLLELASVSRLDMERAFVVPRAHGTAISSLLSKYTQIDLELWHLESSLRSSQPDLSQAVHAERSHLFDIAQKRLALLHREPGVHREYERLMLEVSPLRHHSLAQAIAKDGDETLHVWRGDYSFARLLGMAPNNDPRQSDALQIASQRAKQGGVGSLISELAELESSGVGSAFISTTSDLSLLTDRFADKEKTTEVDFGVMAPLAGALLTALGTTRSGPDGTVVSIGDRLGVPGTLLEARIKQADPKLSLKAVRKAFAVSIPKDAALPGLRALDPGGFAHEQEVHALGHVTPVHVERAWSPEQLSAKV
jgi:hypothetical protein